MEWSSVVIGTKQHVVGLSAKSSNDAKVNLHYFYNSRTNIVTINVTNQFQPLIWDHAPLHAEQPKCINIVVLCFQQAVQRLSKRTIKKNSILYLASGRKRFITNDLILKQVRNEGTWGQLRAASPQPHLMDPSLLKLRCLCTCVSLCTGAEK